jgi:transcriptional regulator with XRE-family HTH domain
MSLDKKELGLKIKEARKIKGNKIGKKYTGNMLATDLDISRSYLGDLESGRVYPNYTLLSKIAEKCEVPLSFFDEPVKALPSFNINAVFAGSGKLIKNINNAELTKEEINLLENYNKSNKEGKQMILSYSDYVSQNYVNAEDEVDNSKNDEFTVAKNKALEARKKKEQYYKENSHLIPKASHDKKGNFTEEDYKHDDDLMMDDDLWND